MTKWKLVGREYIGTNNVTRVTITEDTNWQRIVVNIAGDFRNDSNEAVIDRAISEFIKRERPEFAQEFIDQELVTLKEELEDSKKTIAKHQEEIDVTKGRVAATQEEVLETQMELEESKEAIAATQTEITSTKEDLDETKTVLSDTKDDLSLTQSDLEETKSSISSMQAQVDTLVVSISNLTKEQEEALADKYDPWEVGITYSVGDKVHYESVNYEVLQEHTSQGDWLPNDTPSLYKVIKNDDLETDEGTIEVIDEFEASSTNPYSIGDKVTFQGKVYESTIENNVWSPTDYPQGWKEVTE